MGAAWSSWDPLSACAGGPAPANGQTRSAGGSQEVHQVHQAVDEISAQAVELEEAMMQEAQGPWVVPLHLS